MASVRTTPKSSGSSHLEVVHGDGGNVGSADQRVDPRGALIGDQAQPEPAADPLPLVDEVGIPTLAPQRLRTGFVRAFVACGRLQRIGSGGLGQGRQCAGVEHVLAVSAQHDQEHLVATLGALNEHGSDEGHHDAEEALTPDAFANVVEADSGVRPQGVVVRAQQCVVVVAAHVVGQRAAEKVGDIGHRRPPGDGLPVDHGERPVGFGLPEQHVVQPVVAVHQPVNTARCLLLGAVCVETGDKPLTHLAMRRSDVVAVAFHEPGIQLRDERLVHRRFAIEPLRVGKRGVAEQRRVQAAQLCHRQHRLFDCGAADLVADDGRACIPEQQVEHARFTVETRVEARRDGTADARSDIGVEPHLAFVETQCETRLAAHRVACGDLEHDRTRSGLTVGVGQGDPVALAHLAGADPLGGEPVDRARADGSRQPLCGQVVRPLQPSDRHSYCPCGRCRAECRRRRARGFGRRTRMA